MSELAKSILVVDTDHKRRIRIAHTIQKFGYNTFVASGEPDFNRIVHGLIPHAVILNVNMPKVSGMTYLDNIRSSRGLSMVKVITYGGSDDGDAIKESKKHGANASFKWPIGITELFALIQNLIESPPRKVPRMRVLARTSVTSIADNKTHSFFATSISELGVFLHTNAPFPKGTKLRLSIDIPATKPFTAIGSVIYTAKYDKARLLEPGMGVLFSGLDDNTRKGFRSFVEGMFLAELPEGLII